MTGVTYPGGEIEIPKHWTVIVTKISDDESKVSFFDCGVPMVQFAWYGGAEEYATNLKKDGYGVEVQLSNQSE